MFAKLSTCALNGIDGYVVDVEVFVSAGLPTIEIVGLPDTSVKESKERVRAAIKISEYEFVSRRITINLSPASLRKEGALYDLPISIALLIATEQIREFNTKDYVVVGELSLDGIVNRVRGILPITLCAKQKGFKKIIVPKGNAKEASIVEGIEVIPVGTLKEAVSYLNGEINIEPVKSNVKEILLNNDAQYSVDFCEVKGQEGAKRALEISASGGHNILMSGSAGCGKTMLAKRLVTILPDMSFEECLEVTKIHSISGNLKKDIYLTTERPFRSPHHTISQIGLIGGGTHPKPGEISLAHCGILFLDELSEFSKKMLESLRQPLEDGNVTLSRINYTVTYPAKIMLVGAMNLCPCGNKGNPAKQCVCSDFQLERYREKISGALLDRFDLQIELQPVKSEKLELDELAESSTEIKKRVDKARQIQTERFKGRNIFCNADMMDKEVRKYCSINKSTKVLIEKSIQRLGISARGYTRILKVSRTIADLDGSDLIEEHHVLEALQYRNGV